MAAFTNSRSYKIYLMHTTESTSANWISATNAQLVYTGSPTLHTGLNTFQFSTPFSYNGTDNLLLIVIDETGSYSSGNTWRSHTAPFQASRYNYNDNNPYSTSSTPANGTSITVRNNVIFGAGCDTTTTCVAPNTNVSNITANTADINWVAGYQETAWELEYKTASDTVWNSFGPVSASPANLTNLTSNTVYNYRMRSDCGGGEYSYWTGGTFTTDCDAITVTSSTPWFEDFESYTGTGELPLRCWATPITDAYYHGPFVYGPHGGSCHSGVYSAEMKGGTNMVVLPEFTNDIHELRLSFYATSTNPSLGTLEVGVITDIDNPNSFELLSDAGRPCERGSASAGNGNYMGPFDFNSVTATTGRIALRYTNTSASQSWNLDDFTVEIAPQCPSPVKNSVTASNIGNTTADISWIDNDPSHNSWTVYYTPSNSSAWQSVIANTQTVTLTGLTASTSYDVYVITNCAIQDPNPDATITYTFSTATCDLSSQCAFTFNLVDNLSDGWDGASLEVKQNGVTIATMTVSSGSTATETVSICDNAQIELIWHSGSYDYECSYSVLDPNNNEIYATSGTPSGTYTFTASCSGTIPSQCNTPTNITFANVSQTGAVANWTAGGDEAQWNLQYMSVGGNWSPSILVNAPTYTFSGLTANTIYLVRVQAVCTSGVSDWSMTASFTTLAEGQETCYAPTDLTATNITDGSVTLDWNQQGTPDSWTVSYKKSSASTYTTKNTNSHPYTLSDLENGAEYEVFVVANCGAQHSGESNHVTFTAVGIEDYLFSTTALFPNPTTGEFRIQNSKFSIQSVEVFDVFGKLMSSVEVNDNTVTIDATSYASGVYFVRISTEKGMVTKRIVKK